MSDHDEVRREHGYHRLRVKRVVEENGEARSFVLDIPEDLRDTFRYRAGQFCTFRVHVGGEEHLRSYSMSSAPETDEDLVVTVKHVPGGAVSPWFTEKVAEGDSLEVTKPAGVFCVREGERPVVAYCGGSGITPVLSVVKAVLASTARGVKLFYANQDRASVIFDDELRKLAERYPGRLKVHHHLDSERGLPGVADITAFTGDDSGGDHYICGPAPFMDLVEGTLLGLDVPGERILIERFGDAGLTEPAVAATGGEEVPEALDIILHGKKTTVAYQPGDTVLETARRGGLQPPFSCEAGNCATCMAMLRGGTVRMRENNALTDDEVEEGWILTCQSLPRGTGTLEVEYESF